MVHIFAFLIINLFFGAALYSADKTIRKSLFNVSGMVAVSYALLLLFNGAHWFLASLFMSFIAIESFRRAKHIKNERANTNWLEMQLMLIVIVLATLYFKSLPTLAFQAVLLSIFATVALIVNILMRRHVTKHVFKPAPELADIDLPTVSLLIPARNEDHALEETLNEALKSDYPKLEILVLDDCSEDKTPEVIRSFAHQGIRFVEGQPLSNDWLGKNFALEQLRVSANGDIHIYADVDAQFQPYSIRELVQFMLGENVTMVSVLPATRGFDLFPLFIRPLTNFFLTLAPFGALKPARAYGTVFALTAKAARNYSFSEAKNSMITERELATKLKNINRYEPIIGDFSLGVTIRKHVSSQLANQQRSLYPLLGSNTLASGLYATGLIASVLLPFAALPLPMSMLIYMGFVVAYVQYLLVHAPQSAWMAPFQLAFLIILEAVACFYSLYKYSFSELAWKDRRVCMLDDGVGAKTTT